MEILPPPQYDHPYKGYAIVRHGSLAEVEHFCHTQQGIVSAYQALGCANVTPKRCLIMIPKVGGKISARMQNEIRRHEIAHCNGWGADHPR